MLKILLLIPVLFVFAFPQYSRADEEGFREKERPKNWKITGVFGSSFSGQTSYTVTESNGTLLGSSSNDRSNAAFLFAGELTYQSQFPFGLGFIVEGTRYEYTSGGSDGELALYAMPRLAQSFGPIELWAGVGLGVMFNNLGGSSTGVEDGVSVVLTNMSPASFAWSPRVGVDIDVGRQGFIGAQISYTHTVIPVPFSATEGGTTITGTEDGSRGWVAAAFRIGGRF
jgi:hypothetical protein